MTPYQVLGIPETATPEEIKRAWKKKAQETHPDKHPNDEEASARFLAVRKAYEELCEPKVSAPPSCPTCGAPLGAAGHPCPSCRNYESAMQAMREQQALVRKRLREQEIACYRVNQHGLEREFGWMGDWNRRGVLKWWDAK